MFLEKYCEDQINSRVKSQVFFYLNYLLCVGLTLNHKADHFITRHETIWCVARNQVKQDGGGEGGGGGSYANYFVQPVEREPQGKLYL
jgi:hypothetical protein